MKGYLILFLLVALLLMLLPVPALPRPHTTAAPNHDQTTESTATDAPSPTETTTAVSGNEPSALTFKMLAGDTVTELPCREFLIRTLAFEMSPTYHSEALKAQAVAAYTYYGRRQHAQKENADPALKGADFKVPDDTFPQEFTVDKLKAKWNDQFDIYYNKICAAVDGVIGRYMTYGDEWIDACYFAISNGSTESAAVVWGSDIPYLRPIASPGDRLAPNYESVVTLTKEQVKSALTAAEPTILFGEQPSTWFGKTTLSDAGTVTSLAVGDKELTGTAIRTALGLRSASFSVEYEKDAFRFTVHGHGHGVGMSQYGADYLARQGYSWEEILKYYYNGVTIH